MNEYWERSNLLYRRSPLHPCVYHFVYSKLELIKKRINFRLINNGLELGCGNGYFTLQLKQEIPSLIAIDLSTTMLNLCKKNNNFDLIQSSGLKLPFKDNIFDLVFGANILHHLNNQIEIIKEIRRVTKKYFVLIEPNRNNFFMDVFAIFKKEERQIIKFSLNYLNSLLIDMNFNIIDSFSTGVIAPNKLPIFLKPFLKSIDLIKTRIGLYNVIISKKK